MTRPLLLALTALALAGCASMDLEKVLSNSRAGCARTSGMGYSIVITTANADKSAKTDDDVEINPETCAMRIRNTGNAGARPVPGTVTTVTIPPQPGTVTTTVAPAGKPSP